MDDENPLEVDDSDWLKKSDHLHTFQLCAEDGTVFRVNPYFLAEFSSVFEERFLGDSGEARQKKAVLQDETPSSISNLLGLLGAREYYGKITRENVPQLLRMASKYDIKKVFKECRAFIGLVLGIRPPTSATVLHDSTLDAAYYRSVWCAPPPFWSWPGRPRNCAPRQPSKPFIFLAAVTSE